MNSISGHLTSFFLAEGTTDQPSLLEDMISGRRSENAVKQRKDYTDLRDRLAYVYIMGSYPTHLRTLFTQLIGMATRKSVTPTSLDQLGGAVKVSDDIANRLQLENHPMVRSVREHLREGFKLTRSREDHTDRRPYSRVFLHRKIKAGRTGVFQEKKTVYINGAVKDGWN